MPAISRQVRPSTSARYTTIRRSGGSSCRALLTSERGSRFTALICAGVRRLRIRELLWACGWFRAASAVAGGGSRSWFAEMAVNVLLRMRYSHAVTLLPGSTWPNAAQARANVSAARSSAAAWPAARHRAARYTWSRCGSTWRSNRPARRVGPSVTGCAEAVWATTGPVRLVCMGPPIRNGVRSAGLPCRGWTLSASSLRLALDPGSAGCRLVAGLPGAGQCLGLDHVWIQRPRRKVVMPPVLAPGRPPVDADTLHLSSPRQVTMGGHVIDVSLPG